MKGQSKIKNIIHIHTLEILKKYTGFSYKKTILEATTPRRFSCRTVPVSSPAHEKLQPINKLLLRTRKSVCTFHISLMENRG